MTDENPVRMCRRGIHPLTDDNLSYRASAPGRTPTPRCRACERAARAARAARSRERRIDAKIAGDKPAAPKPRKLTVPPYRYEIWTDDRNRYYLRIEAERFEYTDAALYHRQGRHHLRALLTREGVDPALIAGDLIEEVDREHDHGNPHWIVAVTIRTVHPIPITLADQDREAS